MAYFSLKENSYEKRKCFFWLLVRVNSVDKFIFEPMIPTESSDEIRGFLIHNIIVSKCFICKCVFRDFNYKTILIIRKFYNNAFSASYLRGPNDLK